MPFSQEQRLLLLGSRQEVLDPVQSLATPSPTPPPANFRGRASPAQRGVRQPIVRANTRARQNRPRQWCSPSSQLAQLCPAVQPRLGSLQVPRLGSLQIVASAGRLPVAEKQAWLLASRTIPRPELHSPPDPPRPRTHRQQSSVPSERESRTSPWHHTGPNGARTTRTCRLTRRPGR